MLRAKMGTEALASVRENRGGLLTLLERFPRLFRVDRIPKNDSVSLLIPAHRPMVNQAQAHQLNNQRMAGNMGMVGGGRVGMGMPMINGMPQMVPMPMQGGSSNVSRCLHVGNVSATMTEDELRRQFSMFGPWWPLVVRSPCPALLPFSLPAGALLLSSPPCSPLRRPSHGRPPRPPRAQAASKP